MLHEHGIHLDDFPELDRPILIAGFNGWGNALNVSMGMADYLIHKLDGRYFGRINPDAYYRYDDSRPMVTIEEGSLKSMEPPGGAIYQVRTSRDLVVMRADEPNLQWHSFVDDLFSLCLKLNIETIITIGSMYDRVLHTDRIISGIASRESLYFLLKKEGVAPISYNGPAAIHSLIQWEGRERGFDCMSLWGHCPYFLDGTTHFGLMSTLGRLLAALLNFEIDVAELEDKWKNVEKKIQILIDENPNLKDLIREIRKTKLKDFRANIKRSRDEKVINLKDFMDLS